MSDQEIRARLIAIERDITHIATECHYAIGLPSLGRLQDLYRLQRALEMQRRILQAELTRRRRPEQFWLSLN